LKSRHSSLNIPVSVFTMHVINKRRRPLLDPQSKQSFKINRRTVQPMFSMICDVSTGSRSVIGLPGAQKKRQCRHCMVLARSCIQRATEILCGYPSNEPWQCCYRRMYH
jgi:hypothetical protein